MDVGGIETSLFEIHALLATFSGFPDIALEQDEAHALAAALANVQKHYPSLRLLSEKHMAIAGFGLTASRIYGKRVAIVLGIQPAQQAPLKLRPNGATEPDVADAIGAPDHLQSWFKPS